MNLTFARDELTAAVAFAARALPRNAPHPALNGLRLTCADGQAVVSGFDFDTYAEARAGSATEAADLLLPGRSLASYLAGMRSARVEMTVSDRQADIVCGSARVTLPLLSLADYPSAPPVPASIGTVDAESFAAGFGHVREPVDSNDAIAALRGVCAQATSDTLTLWGGSRVVQTTRQVDGWTGDGETALLLPLTVGDAAKSLSGTVALGADDARVALSSDDRTVVVRLMEGQYPQTQRLIDAHTTSTAATLDRDELVAALKWVSSGDTRKETFGLVVLTTRADEIEVALRVIEGPTASTTVEAKVDGDDLTTGWMSTVLLAGLAATSAGTVTLNFGGTTKAVLIRAESDPSYAALAMPVRL